MQDMKSLDLNLLKGFDALYDERSVTRAADRLSLTQPAVSGILTRLRASFGDPLFVRAQRGVTPTPRAHALAPRIKQLLYAVDAMLRPQPFDPAEASFTLSLAATDYALHVIVTPFLAALRARAPGMRVAVHAIEDGRIAERLEKGELDFALLTPETTAPELHARRLFDEEYVCAMRAGHPAASGGGLTLEQFCTFDQAIVSLAGGGFRGATDDALEAIGYQRKVSLSVPSFLSLLRVLRTSDLLAAVPARLIASAPGLVVLPPPIPIQGFTKLLVWHERTHADPAYAWLRALLVETAQSQPVLSVD
jgi:DNA-binding transcriptional LysR family regulator